MKKLFSVLLSVCMLMTCVSLPTKAAEQTATEADLEVAVTEDMVLNEEASVMDEENLQVLTADGDTSVTRLEWLTALTTTFEMEVEEENYPDNYYSDIDSTHANYYEIMLATEFGLVDVEAGEAFRPDDAATREFAAYTLNLCLGYSLDEGTEYTFAEADTVTYPDDIQVAVDKGWFTLTDGAFLPELGITVAEKDAMLAYAEEVLATATLDESHENTYSFVEGVIIIPDTATVMLTDEDEITISNCDVALAEGDIFAVVQNDLPIAKRVVSVTTTETEMVVQVESVALDEAFTELDVQGEMDVDLSQVQAVSESVDLTYIVGGTAENNFEDGTEYETVEAVGNQEISAVMATQSFEIPEIVKKEYDIADGVTADITCTISNVTPTYDASLFDLSAYFKVNATMTFTCNVSVDVLEAMGVAPSIQLAKVPVGIVGYMKAELELSFEGSVTLTLVEKISVGIQFDDGEFRMIKDFKKQSFTIQAQVEASAGVKLTMGFDVVFLKGSIYGRVGAKSVVELNTYDDGQAPSSCTHVNAWMYASVGANVKIDLGIWDKDWSKSYDIYTKKNSPVKVVFHYEDGKAVNSCTRDGEDSGSAGGTGGIGTTKKYNYFTPLNSKYGYSGASTGVDDKGNTFTMFTYDLDDAGYATITGYSGNVSALSIPSELDGYRVVGIGGGVFKDNLTLRIVVIPDTVTEIKGNAFSGCINLESVTLSKKLENLEYGAFADCYSLRSIEIPKNLEKSGNALYDYNDGPFRGCTNLKEVTFEKGTTTIVGRLFENCPGIEEIVIPDTVTVIEASAFNNCSGLKSVIIGSKVTEIKTSAFSDCTALKEIVIPDSVKKIGGSAFAGCSSLEKVTLSKKLQDLVSGAFADCNKLTSVEIPKSLEKSTNALYDYDDGAFNGCSNLKEVTFEAGTTVIPARLFANCPGIETIVIPDTVTTIDDSAFRNCDNLKNVTISKNATFMGASVFEDCISLEEIVIPNTVNEMESSCFSGASKLKSVILSQGLTEIPASSFLDCVNLTSITIPSGVTTIGNKAFENTGLTQVTLPDGATSIGEAAFRGCASLESVSLGSAVKTIGDYGFRNCESLESISMPNTITSMGNYCFAGCEALATVTLSQGLTTIPNYAFNGCTLLERVVIPYRVTKINTNAFSNCTSLTEVTIPRGAETLADDVFSYPEDLTIYGISGTYAETYANTIGATFVNKEVHATVVTLSEAALTLGKNKSTNLVLSVEPENFTDEVVWTSSDTSIATISDAGKVVTKSVGEATITVTVGGVSASCKVSVVTPITGLSLSQTSLVLGEGTTATLTPSITPSSAGNKTLIWTSSNESIATVDANGVVTAVAIGTATITATTQDGSNLSASCEVTVTEYNPFGDVASGEWYYKYVMFAYNHSLMGGKGKMEDGVTLKFDPANTITRAEFVRILYNKEETPDVAYRNIFDDVPEGEWYSNAILWAYDKGIVSGKGEKFFDVNGNITRLEIAQILYKYALYKNYDISKAVDTDLTGFVDDETVANWGMKAMKWAVEYKVVTGKSAEGGYALSPDGNAIRAEAATMMNKFMVAYEGVEAQ